MKKYIHIVVFIFVLFCQTAFAEEQQEEIIYYDVFAHQEEASNVLLGWGGGSVIAGAVMLGSDNSFTRSMGIQNIAWGGIDAALALWLKSVLSERRLNNDPEEGRKWFRDIMAFNFFLDIAYIAAGFVLTLAGEENIKGHGAGIITQGIFLMAFDGINYIVGAELEKRFPDKE